MRVFMMVDMEGISGIVLSRQVEKGTAEYAEARHYLMADTNACITGCFLGGATKVVVRDAHSSGTNMPWQELDSRAEIVQGCTDLGRMHDIQKYDALILLGYHAMAGVRGAVLEHTMSSKGWQRFHLNGKEAGEIAIDAGIAADAGVPTIMVSGDDKLCKEAKQWLPGVHVAQVKVGYASEGARLLSPAKAQALITRTAESACRDYQKIKPLTIKKPVKMRLELVERNRLPAAAANAPYRKIIDGRTFEVTGKTVSEALSRL